MPCPTVPSSPSDASAPASGTASAPAPTDSTTTTPPAATAVPPPRPSAVAHASASANELTEHSVGSPHAADAAPPHTATDAPPPPPAPAPAPPASASPTSERADFTFSHRLGAGSFGEVFRVTRHVDGQDYVIKVVPIASLGAREQLEALNEVKLLAPLDHPRVVCYLDSFIEQGKLHIVMELCRGGDLRQLLDARRGALLPEAQVWEYLLQTTEGLAHLHSLKILHRDLKSSNLFLAEHGIKIGDLGVARLLGASTQFASTMVGTPYYLSPELCENAPYNDKADVWALGVLAYELATLIYPFRALNQAALALQILRGAYERLPSHFSPRLQRFVDACLQRQPAARPSAAALLARPASPARAAPLAPPASPSCAARPPPPRVRSSARPPRPAAAAAAAAAGGGGGGGGGGGSPARGGSGLAGNRVRGRGGRAEAAGGGPSAARRGVHDTRRREEERKAAEAARRVAEMLGAHDERVAEQRRLHEAARPRSARPTVEQLRAAEMAAAAVAELAVAEVGKGGEAIRVVAACAGGEVRGEGGGVPAGGGGEACDLAWPPEIPAESVTDEGSESEGDETGLQQVMWRVIDTPASGAYSCEADPATEGSRPSTADVSERPRSPPGRGDVARPRTGSGLQSRPSSARVRRMEMESPVFG